MSLPVSNEDVYEAANGHQWTRGQLRRFWESRDCEGNSATLVSFGFAMMLRDDGVERYEALTQIRAWCSGPRNRKFERELEKGVDKVYDRSHDYQFVKASS